MKLFMKITINVTIETQSRSFKIKKLNPLFEKLQYHEARPPNFHLGQAHSKVGFVMSHGCYSIQLVLQGYGDAAG